MSASHLTPQKMLRFKRRVIPINHYGYRAFPVLCHFKPTSPVALIHNSSGDSHSNMTNPLTLVRQSTGDIL